MNARNSSIFHVVKANASILGRMFYDPVVILVLPNTDRARLDRWICESILTRVKPGSEIFIAYRSDLANPSMWETWKVPSG
jgi:hypothetical protein